MRPAPLGRLTAGQWRVLVSVADAGEGEEGDGEAGDGKAGDGELRITPWRSIVLPRASTRRPVDGYAQLVAAGLSVAPDGPWESVTACTGRPGCAKALSDVRADARAVVDAAGEAPAAGPAGPAGAPVHWSGCERRCGHPRGAAWVDLVATPDGYRLDGRPVPSHELAQAVADARSQPRVSEDAVKK